MNEEQLDPDLVRRLARRFDKLTTNMFAAWYRHLNVRVLVDEDTEEEAEVQALEQYEEWLSDSRNAGVDQSSGVENP